MTGTGATASPYRWDKRERCYATPHVPPGLPALRNDDVHPISGCAPRFLRAADRVHKKPSGVMHQVDIAVGIAPDERHDPQTRREGLIDSTALILEEDEVAGKRPVGEDCRFANHLAGVIGPRQSQAAEAAGIGDRGGQAGICRQRRQDDRVFYPQQLAHRRVGTHWDGALSGARGAG
jgi:hypothetical protein